MGEKAPVIAAARRGRARPMRMSLPHLRRQAAQGPSAPRRTGGTPLPPARSPRVSEHHGPRKTRAPEGTRALSFSDVGSGQTRPSALHHSSVRSRARPMRVMISAMSSSVTISGGQSAMVSPTARLISPSSAAMSAHFAPHLLLRIEGRADGLGRHQLDPRDQAGAAHLAHQRVIGEGLAQPLLEGLFQGGGIGDQALLLDDRQVLQADGGGDGVTRAGENRARRCPAWAVLSAMAL